MTAPSAYIPNDRRHALAAGFILPDHAEGAALFADISGFTPLTEGLTRVLGHARAAEELVFHLDRIYDALIAEVDHYGGSVIGFSGDAITCWFDGDDARRATASAFAIQDTMQQFAAVQLPGSGAVAMSVKVAVAAGPVRRFLVGDPAIQLIDVLAGNTMDRLGAGEQVAERGEVILDEQTWQPLAALTRLRGWRTHAGTRYAIVSGLTQAIEPKPWTPLAVDALSPAQVRPWVLAPVYERLQSGQGQFLAELRPTTVLFLQFEGIDYDGDAQAGVKLDTFVRRLQQILARYEGTLIALTFGDKGSYLEAALGAPIAHDDDAERALAAALELADLADEFDFIKQTRIGISRGRMRTGAYGSRERLTYGVQGDEVNLAARLMQRAAPQQILVSDHIAKAIGSAYRFAPLGALRLKGKQDPVNVFQVVQKQERRARAATLEIVGRAAERTLLTEQLQALRASRTGRLVLVQGEAGIGKSRLLEYLRQEAQAAAATVLSGAADEVERTTPYYAWRPVFAQMLGLEALPDDKAVRRQHVLTELETSYAPDLVRFAPLLNAVLPLEFPENELTAQMSGQVRSDNTHLLLGRFLQHLASAWPLVLLLEDAQWFDSSSWALAAHVARQVTPLLLVIAARPLAEPLPPDYVSLLGDPAAVRMELEPLPAGDLEELIRQRLGVKTLPAQVTELVRRKAEGNPFFSEELVFALRDAALIRITGDRCEIAPNVDLDAVAFPDTVQEVVTSRIDRLTPAQQLTLKVASVIGRAIIFHLLSDTFPVDSDRPLLHAQLESLSRLDFTVLDTPEPELVYIFKHVITQEVSYSLLLFAQRRELHRHVAEWYERMYASDLSPYYALLAHHWTKAEVPAKAMEYLEQAGGQALRNFANNEAFAAFEEALKIAADPALAIAPVRRARWELLAGEACVNLSKYVEGRRHIEAGLALAGQPVPQGAAGQGAFVLVQLLRQLKHRSLGARTLSSPEERSARLELTRAYERLAEATYFQGETLLPVYSALRGLNLAETTGPTPEQGRSAAAVGAILGFIPMHGVATSYLDRALKIAEASEHLESREYVSMTASYYYSGVGNWGQVTERADEVLALARRMGDIRRWQDVTSHKLAMLDFRGEYAAAIQLAEELEAVARRRQDVRFMALALQGKAYAQLYLGKLEEAISTLRAIDALVSGGDQVTVLPIKMELLGMLAIASLRSGDVDAALQNAAQTLALTARAMPSFYAALSGYTGPVDVYLTVKEQNFPLPDLSMQTQRACKALAKYAQVFSIGVPGSLLQRGRYDWLANKPGAAFKAWQECLERAQALEMPLEQGRAHYELARRLPPNDPAQAEHRAQAIELFTRLNAAYDLARAHAL